MSMKSGYLYIISNVNFPGYYKIGITDNIKKRLHTYQTGDPHRKYKIEFYIFHKDCLTAEKNIKNTMKHFAKSRKNEWFECDLQTAIVRLQEQVECED